MYHIQYKYFDTKYQLRTLLNLIATLVLIRFLLFLFIFFLSYQLSFEFLVDVAVSTENILIAYVCLSLLPIREAFKKKPG